MFLYIIILAKFNYTTPEDVFFTKSSKITIVIFFGYCIMWRFICTDFKTNIFPLIFFDKKILLGTFNYS